jgi:ribosomal-protein-alanine N-acetyltransferase
MTPESSTTDLSTPRLVLRAATRDMLRADHRNDRIELRELTKAFVPDAWPPAYYAENREGFVRRAEASPEAAGWHGWYLVHTGEQRLIGFIWVERPGPEGDVETGYAVLERYRGQGLTPEAMAALLTWTFSHAEAKRVVAHTFPHVVPAIRVLEKAGFSRAQLTSDGICVYEKRR